MRALTRICLVSISSSGGMPLALDTVAVTASAAHCAAPVTPLSCSQHTRYMSGLRIIQRTQSAMTVQVTSAP